MFENIYFRRSTKVAVNEYNSESALNFAEVASMDANLRKLGYTLSGPLAERLLHAPVEEIKYLHDLIVKEAKEIKGVRRYAPMYPNFPTQVMEASEAELYINAMMHYFGDAVGIRVMPKYDKLARPELDFDESKFTQVGLGSEDDFKALMIALFTSKSAFSQTDKDDISSLSIYHFVDTYNRAAKDIDNRENKAFIGALVLNLDLNINHKIDTATDVLRLAVAMSNGDVSLAEKTKFRNFKRSERRLLLSILEEVADSHDILEDMLRYESEWKRLGERLHPGEYPYAKVNAAFKAVRENAKFRGFNSMVERGIAEGQVDPVVRLLSKRPGEFARRLDKILRMSGSATVQRFVVSEFAHVAHNASATVLIQALNNFETREDREIRTFVPKGNISRIRSVPDNRTVVSQAVLSEAQSVLAQALVNKFSDKESLGKVYIDPALSRVAIPFGLRSASKGNVMGRGTRLTWADDTNFLRFFIWWKDGTYRTDIDLSATFYDDNFGYVDAITYYNLRGEYNPRGEGAVHSGDITSAPKGASEFIDINIAALRERGIRYVSMTLHNFSGQSYDELPECFAGFMERRNMKSGEIYDPRTVTAKVDLTAKSLGATPFIFDLCTGEAIWVDMNMQINGRFSNVANTKGQITNMVQSLTSLYPPTLGKLFELHAQARGTIVLDKDEADVVFSLTEGVTPAHVEEILSEYL